MTIGVIGVILLSIYAIITTARVGRLKKSLLILASTQVMLIDEVLEIKNGNKEKKNNSKKKRIATRSESTKGGCRVYKTSVSESKILRKFRGNKDFLQSGGNG